jgi:ketosteroid isomerase-like protein
MPNEPIRATQDVASSAGVVSFDASRIRELTARWVQLWSPGCELFGAERFERYQTLFAGGDNELLVFDDFGGTVTTITSWQAYVATWSPVMQGFASAQVALVSEPRIVVAGEMALSTFTFELDARTREGAVVTGLTYASHVWKRGDDSWRIVHEHLTGSKR